MGILVIKANTSVAAALDSLLTAPSKDKHIIECNTAAAFARLQGARAVLANDALFDKVCNMLSDSQNPEFNAAIAINNSRFMANFFKEGEILAPGTLCYFAQLDDHSLFTFDGKGHFKNIAALGRKTKRSTAYQIKHRESCMQGLNVLLLSDRDCVFFDPDHGVTTLAVAAQSLVDGLDEDLTSAESEEMCKTSLAIFNSIKYKDRDDATRQILASAQYQTPDFTKVFACAATIKARDEAKDRVATLLKALQTKVGNDWLKVHSAIKGLSVMTQSKVLEGINPTSQIDEILKAIATKTEPAGHAARRA